MRVGEIATTTATLWAIVLFLVLPIVLIALGLADSVQTAWPLAEPTTWQALNNVIGALLVFVLGVWGWNVYCQNQRLRDELSEKKEPSH